MHDAPGVDQIGIVHGGQPRNIRDEVRLLVESLTGKGTRGRLRREQREGSGQRGAES
jgi:hypothetical protein